MTNRDCSPKTLVDKIWDRHLVAPESPGSPGVLYVDLHLIHEVTSPQAFATLAERGLTVRRPDRTVATVDHAIPTTPGSHLPAIPIADPAAAEQVGQLERNCRRHGIVCFGRGDERQGIVHVIGPELGLTQPGMTVVCGDSHTSTHGALGALGFGIGTSEVGQVLATQCLLQRRPRQLAIEVAGRLPRGVAAKDLVLALIARIGVGGGVGSIIEYRGAAIERLTVEERLTVCNMSIEAGARAGLIAPDDTTIQYLANRPAAPRGEAWELATRYWGTLRSDPEAAWDRVVTIDGSALEPMITFGTTPGMAIPITAPIPEPGSLPGVEAAAARRALAYLALEPGKPLIGQPIDVVFLGSCTNSRLSDLEQAARILEGRRVAPNVTMIVVPGSRRVKAEAEARGLDRLFLNAGAQWREPGCSMCLAMNGDELRPGQYAVSTSNRNFEGRQGPGGRTFLASPATAAATALAGRIVDPRPFLEGSADA